MKKMVNTLLISTIVLTATMSVSNAETEDTTATRVVETATTQATTVEDTQATSETALESTSETIELVETSKQVKEDKQEDKQIQSKQLQEKATKTKIVDLNYIKDDTNSMLNSRDFNFKLNKEDNTLTMTFEGKTYQISASEKLTEDSYRYTLNTDIKDINKLTSINTLNIADVEVNIKEDTVKLISDYGYLKMSKQVQEDKALTPVAQIVLGMYDGTKATIFTDSTNRYVIDLEDATNGTFKTDNLIEQERLLEFENDKDRILVKTIAENGWKNLKDATKRSVIKQEDSKDVGLDRLESDYGWLNVNDTMFKDVEYMSKALKNQEDGNIFVQVKDVANAYFYPKIENVVYIASEEEATSTLNYEFNGKGDIKFKINSLDEKASNQQNYYYLTFKTDDTLKKSKAYQENIGKTVEKDMLVDFGKWGTGATHTITEFKEDEITVKVARSGVDGASKGYDLYAIDFDIDAFKAPPVEPVKPVAPPKEDKKEPIKQKETPKTEPKKKLPKAGNNINESLALTTILSTLTSGLYFFKRK